ncbi:hypothetical protein CBA19CS22_00500 [Caballeronia novacaledonica]|uniref:Uncharacterized protein n=1 Tax=Caballeronia novacaledonica TaxID=1544861 RepID=A0ACB5QIQ8_9BURK|nr:hypothetical protein CBA19CS22_00500 [Caballeronia novacaledonica]
MEGVTRGYYESTQGRDPQKRMIYQAYGINGLDARGQFSSPRLLEQIAAAGESVNSRNGPLARHRLFEALDAGGLEDLLNKGAGGVRDRYSRGLALAASEEDIRHANDFAEAMSKLDAQFDKTKQTILGGLAPALTTFLEGVERVVARLNGQEYVPTRWNGQGYVSASSPDAPPAANMGDRAIDGLEKFGNFCAVTAHARTRKSVPNRTPTCRPPFRFSNRAAGPVRKQSASFRTCSTKAASIRLPAVITARRTASHSGTQTDRRRFSSGPGIGSATRLSSSNLGLSTMNFGREASSARARSWKCRARPPKRLTSYLACTSARQQRQPKPPPAPQRRTALLASIREIRGRRIHKRPRRRARMASFE